MPLTAGIVGLPNVGKSTLFNAITQSSVEAANYPFATINPNVGVVEVPDERMDNIVKLFNPKKTIYTTFEFTDIAGLVKGASQGEGLGNQFLSHIRQTDAICHVVRCFEDPNITHVEGSVDPIRDIEIINLELAIADLQSVENRLTKIERKAQAKDKEALAEYNVLNKLVTDDYFNQLIEKLFIEKERDKELLSYVGAVAAYIQRLFRTNTFIQRTDLVLLDKYFMKSFRKAFEKFVENETDDKDERFMFFGEDYSILRPEIMFAFHKTMNPRVSVFDMYKRYSESNYYNGEN